MEIVYSVSIGIIDYGIVGKIDVMVYVMVEVVINFLFESKDGKVVMLEKGIMGEIIFFDEVDGVISKSIIGKLL